MTWNVHATSRIQLGQVHSMFTRCELKVQLLKLYILAINACYNIAIPRFVFTASIFDENKISHLQICRRSNFTSWSFDAALRRSFFFWILSSPSDKFTSLTLSYPFVFWSHCRRISLAGRTKFLILLLRVCTTNCNCTLIIAPLDGVSLRNSVLQFSDSFIVNAIRVLAFNKAKIWL